MHCDDPFPERHKVRIVVKGLQKSEFSDVYAPVIHFTHLRVLVTGAFSRVISWVIKRQ